MLLRAGLAGLLLIGAVAYFTVRIALRPVEAVRRLTASVTDPRERVPSPRPPTRSPRSPTPSTPPSTPRPRRRPAAPVRRGRGPRAAQSAHHPADQPGGGPRLPGAHRLARHGHHSRAADPPPPGARRGPAPPRPPRHRGSTTDPETVDLSALASQLSGQHLLSARKLDLTCVGTGPAYVRGDRDQHQRLLRNLLDNAARHAAHRVQVTVRGEDEQVVVTVRRRAGCARRGRRADLRALRPARRRPLPRPGAPASVWPSPGTSPTATAALSLRRRRRRRRRLLRAAPAASSARTGTPLTTRIRLLGRTRTRIPTPTRTRSQILTRSDRTPD